MSHLMVLPAPMRATGCPQTGRLNGGKSPRWRRFQTAVILAVAAACFLAITQRTLVVRTIPVLSGFFQALGLPVNIYQAEFLNVRAVFESEGSEARLVVDGQIRNLAKVENLVSDIQISLLGQSGQTIFSWVARLPDNRLVPEGTLNFRTSLDAPPKGYHRLTLKFAR